MDEEDFNQFLLWLDPTGRHKGAHRYEEIRRNLVIILSKRGCHIAEDLADKALDQVINHLPKIIDTYVGEPAKYIVRTAVNLHHKYAEECNRITCVPESGKNHPKIRPDEISRNREIELLHHHLDHCLNRLSAGKRELILKYYAKDKRAKIEERDELADFLGITKNALALRVLRIKGELENCIEDCLKNEKAAK